MGHGRVAAMFTYEITNPFGRLIAVALAAFSHTWSPTDTERTYDPSMQGTRSVGHAREVQEVAPTNHTITFFVEHRRPALDFGR